MGADARIKARRREARREPIVVVDESRSWLYPLAPPAYGGELAGDLRPDAPNRAARRNLNREVRRQRRS